MVLGICNLSVVPLRSDPAHRSEMVNQLLFGECFEILEDGKDWVYIRMLDNDYEGWLQVGQFMLCNESFNPQVGAAYDVVGSVGATAMRQDKKIQLLAGTKLPSYLLVKDQQPQDWDYEVSGDICPATISDFKTEFLRFVRFYNYSPYLWGGRSQYGIDCSGLTQAIFAQFGIQLPRDAYQQAEQGTTVDFATEIKTGDLAFFDNEEGRITHVGVMLDGERIFHASASARIDRMDSEGIFRQDWNRYTHKLRIVKRYFELDEAL